MKISKGKGGRKPRSVYLEIAFWRDGNAIHIAHNDPEGPSSFHVAVRKDGTKPSGHPSYCHGSVRELYLRWLDKHERRSVN